MDGELPMTILFFMLVSSLWLALSYGALFLGVRLSVDAAVLAVLEAAVFVVLSAAVAWLLCRLY